MPSQYAKLHSTTCLGRYLLCTQILRRRKHYYEGINNTLISTCKHYPSRKSKNELGVVESAIVVVQHHCRLSCQLTILFQVLLACPDWWNLDLKKSCSSCSCRVDILTNRWFLLCDTGRMGIVRRTFRNPIKSSILSVKVPFWKKDKKNYVWNR